LTDRNASTHPVAKDHRCSNADAFGDVVQREAQPEKYAERRRARGKRRTDRQTLAKIVQADSERNEC